MVKTALPVQGVRFKSLVKELRTNMLYSSGKKIHLKKKKKAVSDFHSQALF